MNKADGITLNLGGASITVPLKTVLRAMLERMIGEPAEAAADCPCAPVVGGKWHGGIYAGITIHENQPMHLILLPGDVEKKWQGAMDWAKEQGGVLPSRIDGLVLFQNLKKEFQEKYYWTDTQHAAYSGCAWLQGFSNGYQNYDRKGLEYRARAVRRLVIE